MEEGKLDKANMMHTACLRCGEHAVSIPFGLDGISYTHYSYCENCLRKGLELLKAKDEADELKEPFYVIDTPMNQWQRYKGKPMAFKKHIHAEWQIQETEILMRKNGLSGWCGYMFIRPMTLESCGMKKHQFVWLEGTVGDLERKEKNDES